jgi:hypothetical protein
LSGRWGCWSQLPRLFSVSPRLRWRRSTSPGRTAPVIPSSQSRKRRLRRRALLADPRLRPARQPPPGHRGDRRHRDPESAPLQPRPARLLHGLERHRKRHTRRRLAWTPGRRTSATPSSRSYDRGAMTLQALREKVGDPSAPPTSSCWQSARAARTWTTSSRSGSTRRAGRLAGEVYGQRRRTS